MKKSDKTRIKNIDGLDGVADTITFTEFIEKKLGMPLIAIYKDLNKNEKISDLERPSQRDLSGIEN